MSMDNINILVVDDEADMRIFISTVVETRGFKPMTAEDGREALARARSNPPVLVILDVMMPKIDDGIRTYQEFRTDETLKQIPIIMLSAVARKTFFHTIRMLNPYKGLRIPEPDAYLEKPPDAAELVRLIDDLLPDSCAKNNAAEINS
jgi:two-component system phosphate regulon response regulator PhoB